MLEALMIVLCAFALDLLFGDPRWLPHPVRWIGKLIERSETMLRRVVVPRSSELFAGTLLVLIVVPLVLFLSAAVIVLTYRLSHTFGLLVSIAMSYSTLALRGLGDAARAVRCALEAGDLPLARKELSMIVGRDTDGLDESEISRAVVETVAENASDGVVAPLFYLMLGGPALAMAYKAVNTLDSMVGYRNERYIDFGRLAARLDDLANFLPARITALFFCLSAAVLPGYSFRNAWKTFFADGGNHPSPNSGRPEAAMAGALGVRLGGPSTYCGIPSKKPFIGAAGRLLQKKDIALSVRLLYCASLLAALLAAIGAAFLGGAWLPSNFLTRTQNLL